MTRRFLSRKTTVVRGNESKEYYMAVTTVTYSDDGEILDVDTQPFEKEIPGVEYSDTPLVFKISRM